jgi:hypothetical protein
MCDGRAAVWAPVATVGAPQLVGAVLAHSRKGAHGLRRAQVALHQLRHHLLERLLLRLRGAACHTATPRHHATARPGHCCAVRSAWAARDVPSGASCPLTSPLELAPPADHPSKRTPLNTTGLLASQLSHQHPNIPSRSASTPLRLACSSSRAAAARQRCLPVSAASSVGCSPICGAGSGSCSDGGGGSSMSCPPSSGGLSSPYCESIPLDSGLYPARRGIAPYTLS